MSRFEPNAEPSMEEILASIRRIIAEDGTGSKSMTPPPSPARTDSLPNSTRQQSGGFMSRGAFIQSSTSSSAAETKERYFTPVTPPSDVEAERTKDAARSPQPVAPAVNGNTDEKAEPVQSRAAVEEPKAYSEAPPRPEVVSDVVEAKVETIVSEAKSASIPDTSDTSTARLVAQPMSPATQTALAAPDRSRIAASIDAQLAELLGDDFNVLRAAPERQDIAPVAEPIEVRSEPTTATQPTETPVRNDTISDPIMDPAPSSARVTAETSDARDAADPFAFDLGPSPFARPAPAAPVQPSANAAHTPRTPEPVDDGPHKYVDRNPYKLNGAHAPAASPARSVTQGFASREAPAPVPPSQRQLAPFAVPSVSATLGPQRRLEPLSDAFIPSPREDRQPRGFDVAKPSYAQVSDGNRHEASDEPRRNSMLAPSTGPQTPNERTMEDAMADLLRPLLKTWLAENMPKIVERALRREMNERLLPRRDNSNE